MSLDAEFDTIVVGAGSAGCVVASRLSEDPQRQVLLLEAGGTGLQQEVSVPAKAVLLSEGERAWPSPTVAQAAVSGRVVPLVTGRGLGGGSAMNTMGWFHGQPEDFDRWEREGATGWGAEAMAPLLAGIEDHELGAGPAHGSGGPMAVSGPRHLHPVALAFLRAGVEQGWSPSDDLSGDRRSGVALTYSNIRDGRRHSVVDGYLDGATHRANLTVRTRTRAVALVVHRGRAVGVRVRDADGTVSELTARRGVVLTAGALRSPQLLMLSGIGPADHLREHGVPVVADLPAVGAHLQDHPAVPVPFVLDPSVPPEGDPEADYDLARRGPLASLGQAVAMIASTGTGSAAGSPPDLVYGLGMLGEQAGLPAAEGPDGAWVVGLVDPDSRGSVRLSSGDPDDEVLVDPRYLSAPRDRPRLRQGVRDGFTTLGTRALRGRLEPAVPVPRTDEEVDAFVDATLSTYYHPVGTVRMGSGERSAVDARLRVHGVEGLWVADASVMPRITRALPQATVIAVAERAARLVSQDAAAG